MVTKTNNKKGENSFYNDAQRNAAILGAVGEIIDLFGEAIKEHCLGYTGVDNVTGVKVKGLKDIANSVVNPMYQESNINQQAGFSAEIKTTSIRNAEKILAGNNNCKTIRTDNMQVQSDGNGYTIGGVNEQLYDIADVNLDGIYIVGTGRQLKYFGKDAEDCCQKLLSHKCDKYWEAGVEIEVPSDFYEGVLKRIADKEENIQSQLLRLQSDGNDVVLQRKQAELEKLKLVKENLRKGELSKEEARFARLYPELSTLEDILSLSHKAGIKTIVPAATIGLAVSIFNNISAYFNDEKGTKETLLSITKDTGVASVTGYGIGFLGSALSGVMKNADSTIIRAASKTNLPGGIAVGLISTISIIAQYCKGDINDSECFEVLGEQGFGLLATNMFSSYGMAIGGTACAALGSFVGFSIAAASYKVLSNTYKEVRITREKRRIVEEVCAKHREILQFYRLELEKVHKERRQKEKMLFDVALNGIKSAMCIGDIDGFIGAVNQLTRGYGVKPSFENIRELDDIMSSSEPIRI